MDNSVLKWFDFRLCVNGIEFREVALRLRAEDSTKDEIVIRDRHLGLFALHGEFLLETAHGQQDNILWRPISLLQLSYVLNQEIPMSITDSDFGDRTREPLRPLPEPQNKVYVRFERIPIDGDASHVDRFRGALAEGRIRYQIVGGLDARGHCAGHVTLATSRLLGARTYLRQRGFIESPESKYVLVDSRTGWKVRLLEARPRRRGPRPLVD